MFIERRRLVDKFFKEVPRERVVAGYRRTVRGIRASQIRCDLIARDADDHIVCELKKLCSERNVPFRFAGSKAEFGEWLGLDVACAVCGEAVENALF